MSNVRKSTKQGQDSRVENSDLGLMSAMAKASNAGTAIFSADGKLCFENKSFVGLFGNHQKTKRNRLSDFAPADNTSSAYVEFERLRAGKLAALNLECRMTDAAGALFWAKVSIGQVASIDAENSSYAVLNVLNIEGQKKAEDEIARADARWETALEAAGQGKWEFDRATDTIKLSRGWKKLRGVPVDEDVAMDRTSWLTRIHPDDQDHVRSVVQRQDAGESGYDIMEYRERHRDGHYIWIYSRGRPCEFDEAGKPTRVIGTDTDITKLKSIEAELAAQKEQLHVTLQSIADGVITTDAYGIVTFLNPPAEKITGLTKNKAVGLSINKVFRSVEDDGSDSPCDLLNQCLAGGRVIRHHGYSKIRQSDGSDLYLRESVAPLRREDGRVTGAVLIFRDATEQRNMQQELQYLATHDQLTGLPNRTYLEKYLNSAIADARDSKNEHALLLIDLDHFKAVNDGAGHAAGDALLKQIGALIQKSCRKKDCVARIGGDEFVAVLDKADLKQAQRIAQKMVKSISGLTFGWHGQSFKVGASIGISVIDGLVTDHIELMKVADSACYGAKRNGRNCVIVGG